MASRGPTSGAYWNKRGRKLRRRAGQIRDCFHGLNIKLPKCGGLTPARRMITRARQLGLKLMMGSMSESTVGISAIAQARPKLDYVDMDGALLLAKDIATAVTIRKGHVNYPRENSCGVRLLG